MARKVSMSPGNFRATQPPEPVQRVAIERVRFGVYRVVAEPDPDRAWRKTFMARGNRGFSMAAGYASRLAEKFACQLVDRTGRLSAEECAALVVATQSNNAKGII